MPDLKISQLTDGASIGSADTLVAVRAGSNVKIPANNYANANWLTWRNAANNANINGLRLNAANYLEISSPFVRDSFGLADATNWDDQGAFIRMRRRFTNLAGSGNAMISLHGYASGTLTGGDRCNGIYVVMEDDSAAGVTSVRRVTITGMSRSGTTVTVTAAAHGYANGDRIAQYGVIHTFDANVNGTFIVANATTNTYDVTVAGLTSGSYTSGGTVTNRPMYYGIASYVGPTVDRGNLSGTAAFADDIAPFVAYNGGTARGPDCFYAGSNSTNFNKTVTGAVNNGSGLIRLTVVGHNLSADDSGCVVRDVGGVPNATGSWTVTVIDANTIDLVGSTFAGAFTSGGTLYKREFYSIFTCGMNGGWGLRVLGAYTSSMIELGGSTVLGAANYGIDLNGTYFNAGLRFSGAFSQWGIDFREGTYASGCLRLKNQNPVWGRNAADNSNVSLFQINSLNEFQVDAPSRFNSNVAVAASTTWTFGPSASFAGSTTGTGLKLGTAINQLIAFHGAAGVPQRANAAQAAIVTTAATQTTPWGFATQAQADAIVALANELRAATVEKGLIKGSA
jgi:hypothetical protein